MSNSTNTLLDLRTQALYRADMINSEFISTAELNTYINSSCFELYDLLTTAYGEDYHVATPVAFTTDNVSQSYPLPADFYKLLGVDLAIDGSEPNTNGYVTLKPFKFNERNRFAVPNIQSLAGYTNLRYRISGNNLQFNLIPAGGQVIRIWYVPQFTPLVLDTDTLDSINGWYEYIIIDCAIKMLQKEESDVSVLALQKAAMIKRINDTASNRDAGEPAVVSDVRGNGWGGGDSWGEY